MTWYLATEDQLSSTLAQKLIQSVHPESESSNDLGLKGNGKLKADLQSGKYTKLARHYHVMLLTDLDHMECAPSLRSLWTQSQKIPSKMLFRVAVREAEAWLMADSDAFSAFSGVSKGKIPRDIEAILNPKEAMLDLIRKHGNRTAQTILPRNGSSSKVSPSYNAVLCDFVREKWSADRAVMKAPSLKRAMERVQDVII